MSCGTGRLVHSFRVIRQTWLDLDFVHHWVSSRLDLVTVTRCPLRNVNKSEIIGSTAHGHGMNYLYLEFSSSFNFFWLELELNCAYLISFSRSHSCRSLSYNFWIWLKPRNELIAQHLEWWGQSQGKETLRKLELKEREIIFVCYWYRMSSIFSEDDHSLPSAKVFSSLKSLVGEEKRLSLVPPQWPFDVYNFFFFFNDWMENDMEEEQHTRAEEERERERCGHPLVVASFFFFFLFFFGEIEKRLAQPCPAQRVCVCVRAHRPDSNKIWGYILPCWARGEKLNGMGNGLLSVTAGKKPHRAHKHLDQFREGGNIKRKYDVSV